MEFYLLKSTAILAIFWILYMVFLERESIHRFKRFYLLTSLVAAICIPLISIPEYVYVQPLDGNLFINETIPFVALEPLKIIETPFWNLERIIWAIYSIGVAVFAFRFFKNLIQVLKTINTNEKQKQASITFVLLRQLINPHTFFNYIFLNKLKFENNALPKEVILHEETHAKQKHSLDVLFIELLQIVFWFQPFIWLYKTRIKLNHEFLADQAVIKNGFEPVNYQNTLLSYSSNDEDFILANAINYSSIKKRFTVMKTQTSQQKKWVFSLLVLPILGILFYSFSEREIVEIEKTEVVEYVNSNDNDDLRKIAEENFFLKKDFKIENGNGEFVKMKFYELPKSEKRKRIYAEQIPFEAKPLSQNDFETHITSKDYVIQINNETTSNTELINYSADNFVTHTITPISKLAKMNERFVLNLVTETVFNSNIENFVSMYKNIYPDYENKINKSETLKLELAGTYDYLKTNYDSFTLEIIEKNKLHPPTELPTEIIREFEDYYKNTIELYIDKDTNLFLNGKLTTLETIKSELDKIKKVDKSQINLTTEGRVKMQLIDKIMSATGVGISVGYGAEVYDNHLMYAKINSHQITGTGLKLSVNEIYNLNVTHKYYDITSFRIMFPDNKTYDISGNTLSSSLNSKISELQQGQIVSITEIKHSGGIDVLVPVLVEIDNSKNLSSPSHTARSISIKVFDNGTYEVDGMKANKSSLVETVNELHQDISSETRNKIINIHLMFAGEESNEEVSFIYNSLLEYGFHRLVTKNQEVIKSKGNTPFLDDKNSKTEQNPPTAKELAEYNAWAKKMKAKFKKMPESEKVNGYPHMINDETFRYYNSIHDRMTQTQKDKAESLPEAVLVTEWPMPTAVVVNQVPSQQNLPTKKEVAEYNAWVKAFKLKMKAAKEDKNTDYPIIKQKDILRYKSIFDRMSFTQREGSESWPNIPPPPPPPPALVKAYKNGKKKTLNEIIKQTPKSAKSGYEVLDNGESHYYIIYGGKKTYYNKDGYITDDKGNILPPPPPAPAAPKTPSAKQVAKYNAWAKRLNDTPIENRIIKSKDFKYYESIFDRMSAEQKKNAQPLPVPPPPPPPPPVTPKKSKSKGGPNTNQQAMINYLKKIDGPDVIFTQIDAQPNKIPHYNTHLSLNEATSLIEKDSRMRLYPYNSPHSGFIVLISNNVENTIPKLTKNNRIEYIRAISSIGAKFYLDSKEIDFKKAKRILKKNPQAKIASTITPPVVNIRTSLIGIKGTSLDVKSGPNPDSYYDISTYLFVNVESYLKKYKQYEVLRNQKPHYINKSKSQQKEMDALFSDLGGMYFRLSKENKRLVERPIAPIRPYVKIKLDGKTYYKKFEELTKEEKETLPPPPPPIMKKNK